MGGGGSVLSYKLVKVEVKMALFGMKTSSSLLWTKLKGLSNVAAAVTTSSRHASSDLKSVFESKIAPTQEEIKAFRKAHGDTKVGEITADPARDGQGEEPLAQCGCALWRAAAVLRNEGDELLHRLVRNQQGAWRVLISCVGPRSWAAIGEAKIYVNAW